MIRSKIKFVSIILPLILISNFVSSQTIQTEQIKIKSKIADSLHNGYLMLQSKQLQEMEIVKHEDSIKKIALQKQIENLTSLENAKKQELIIELDQLKNKDIANTAAKKRKIDSLRNFVKGYAVVPFLNDTLFSIYTKLGSLSAKDRAEYISKRINNIISNYFFKVDSLQIISSETTVDSVFREIILMSVSENDALWQNTSKENLALKYKTIIGKAIMDYKEVTSWKNIAIQVGLTFFVLFILYILINFLNKLFR